MQIIIKNTNSSLRLSILCCNLQSVSTVILFNLAQFGEMHVFSLHHIYEWGYRFGGSLYTVGPFLKFTFPTFNLLHKNQIWPIPKVLPTGDLKDHDYFFSSPTVPSIHHSASHCRLSRNHNNSNNIDYNVNGNIFIEGFYVLGTVSWFNITLNPSL